MTQPRVAASAAALTELLAGIAHVDGDRCVIDDETRFRDAGIRDVVWSADVQRGRRRPCEAARWIVWEASQELGAPSASIHDLYMARGRGEVHGFTVPAINLRTQVFDMARVDLPRRRQALDVGRDHLRAGAQRAGVHLPAARRVHHERARGLHRRRLAWPGLRPGRPLPVQRQEVRGRPRRRDRGAAQGDARTRSRSATATSTSTPRPSSTCRSPRSTSSSAPTTSAPPSSRRSSASASRTASTVSASAARSARWARRTPPRRSCAPTSTAIAGS